MIPKIRFTPPLFYLSEFFMIFPSILFFLGIVRYDLIQNIFIIIIGPVAGGFVSYNYLERYNPKGLTRTISKTIIAYCIFEIGLVIFFTAISSFLA